MALSTATKNAMVDAATALITHISLHSASPATSGNELAVTRLPVTWPAASGGSATNSDGANAFTDVPAGADVACVGYWSAVSAGTLVGDGDVTDEHYTGAGTYTVDSVTISAS